VVKNEACMRAAFSNPANASPTQIDSSLVTKANGCEAMRMRLGVVSREGWNWADAHLCKGYDSDKGVECH
jgi:hypothetical protein